MAKKTRRSKKKSNGFGKGFVFGLVLMGLGVFGYFKAIEVIQRVGEKIVVAIAEEI